MWLFYKTKQIFNINNKSKLEGLQFCKANAKRIRSYILGPTSINIML